MWRISTSCTGCDVKTPWPERPTTVNGPDPRAWGIDPFYRGFDGDEHEAPPETIEAILRSMRAESGEPSRSGPFVAWGDRRPACEGRWSLVLEDGSELTGVGELPQDLPNGYHRLSTDEDTERMLIVAPRQCPAPPGNDIWGWVVQLYAARSSRSWGMGDLADLAIFGEIAAANGAGIALINPLHASLTGIPQEASPYFPSSRSFRNPIYIAVEHVPGSDVLGTDLEKAIAAGTALNANRAIDRDEVWHLKLSALERIWELSQEAPGLDAYIESQGEPLALYATFCTLVEQYGRDWSRWPEACRHPQSSAVKEFARSHASSVRFHAWLQFVIDDQLTSAARTIPVMHDLAIGVDPGGADAWIWQDALALDMHVGAPPDEFNTLGQDWSLPPFDPWRLREMNYEPLISTLRANMAHGAALRIDHVMGLFRLFWMKAGESPANGTYVRYPADDLLAIVALESQRAGAFIVGEDLGTVEGHTRDSLAAAGVLSYKLMWFEEGETVDYPRQSMAAVTTHDLPTIAGLWTGRDLEIQHELGLEPNEESTAALCRKVVHWAGDENVSAEAATESVHHHLGRAGSVVVTATLEDALGCVERPNYPGTTKEYPNWSVALPVHLDELGQHPGFRNITRILESERTGESSE